MTSKPSNFHQVPNRARRMAGTLAALSVAICLSSACRASGAETPVGAAQGFGINLLVNGDFSADLSGWDVKGKAAAQTLDGVKTLSVTTGGAVQQILLDPAWRTLRVTLRLRAVGVDVGDQDWKTARLAMCFYKADGQKTKGWPNVFMSAGTTGWAVCQRDYTIPKDAVRLEISASNYGISGHADFQDIQIEALDPGKTAVTAAPSGITLLSTPDAVAVKDLPSRDKFHLFVLMGQSNMHGLSTPVDAYRKPDPRVLSLQLNGQWAPAKTPLDMWRVGGFSLGESFGRHYAELHPGVTVGLIMAAQAGDSIEELSKGAVDKNGRAVYDDSLRLITPALAQGTLKAVLWQQGTANAHDKNYPAKLKAYVAQLRTDLNEPNVLFIAGELGRFSSWTTPFNDALPGALKAIPNTRMARSDGLTDRGDKLHFSGESAELYGRRFLAEYLAAVEPQLVSKVETKSPGEIDTFPFIMPWNDTLAGVATDVSFLNDMPAGKNGRIIVKDGHFVEQNTGKRIRFFGVNMCGPEAFPEKAEAEMFAKRLAKAGVNIVRLHHLDNSWSTPGSSIWDLSRADRQHFDAVQLDKLDYLVDQLKRNGIYVNLNLKVSKHLTSADDMPASIAKVPFLHQKRIDFFQRRMIELQKDYARILLTHMNPYTGLSYTEDPAVACVEINNENSLLGFWTRSLGRGLETLPEPFKTELETSWTGWLRKQYASTAELKSTWMADATPPGESILSPTSRWTFESDAPSVAAMVQTPSLDPKTAPAVVVNVTKNDPAEWHIQAHLPGLTLTDGTMYSVSFRAKAEKPATMRVNVRMDKDDWHNMGLETPVEVGSEMRPYTLTFRATSTVPEHARLGFMLGRFTGAVEIADVRLSPGVKDAGLREGEALDTLVHVPVVMTSRQESDWLSFLVDTERTYADEMLRFLKDELKVRANVALTQVDYGGTAGMNREEKMDFADSHAYWQHPSFANNDWNPNKWTIQNTPQVAAFGEDRFGVLGGLAMVRVADKPFTVSEYDHPAPSDYVCEMLPEFSTFAALQDWDAIYTFAITTYSSSRKPDSIQGYFDQNNHPAKWAFYPTAALIFRQGMIPPAEAQATLRLSAGMWKDTAFTDEGWRALSGADIGFLTRRLAVSDQPLPVGEKTAIVVPGRLATSTSEGRGTVRLQKTKSGQVYIASSPSLAAFAGYLGGEVLSANGCTLTVREFGNNFAAVTAVATDGQPLGASQRVLITLCGRVENQNMGWNAARTTVGSAWGNGPTLAQHVPVQLTFTVTGNRKVFALAPDGSRAKQVPAMRKDGQLTFAVEPTDATLFYEMTVE